MADLAESVAGRNSCVVDPNVTEESIAQEYEFGFVMRFPSHTELDAYRVNPAHLSISLAIRYLARNILVFDLAA